MINCHIENEIAIHCDEPEQYSASEYYAKLVSGDTVLLGAEYYELSEITDKLDVEEMREAIQFSITDTYNAIDILYINKIAELQND
mgnify:CR=1 FL=1